MRKRGLILAGSWESSQIVFEFGLGSAGIASDFLLIVLDERVLVVAGGCIMGVVRPGDLSPTEKSIFLTSLFILTLLETDMDLVKDDSGLYSPGPGVLLTSEGRLDEPMELHMGGVTICWQNGI